MKGIRIRIDDEEFQSVLKASKAIGVSPKFVFNRLYSEEYPNYSIIPHDDTVKKCTGCGETKLIDEFGFARPGVLRSKCKTCKNAYQKQYLIDNPDKAKRYKESFRLYSDKHRKEYRSKNHDHIKKTRRIWREKNPGKIKEYDLMSKYGLSFDSYIGLFDKQKYKCAVCGKAVAPNTKDAHVDHDHSTGDVRGILCSNCNKGLGFFKDNPDVLNRAAVYINNYQKKVTSVLDEVDI